MRILAGIFRSNSLLLVHHALANACVVATVKVLELESHQVSSSLALLALPPSSLGTAGLPPNGVQAVELKPRFHETGIVEAQVLDFCLRYLADRFLTPLSLVLTMGEPCQRRIARHTAPHVLAGPLSDSLLGPSVFSL